MYVSPQAIVYQASEHEPLLQRWHEGLELNMRPVAEQLNFIELMFIHSAHARILASPSTNYHLSLEGHSLRWINYVHNTGSRRYADKPDHEAFQLRRENNSWLAQKDTISIQEIILLNPYSADSLSQRLRFDVHALNSVHAQAKQLAKVYIPGPEAEMYLPIEHQFTNKPRKKKKNYKKMFYHAHRISEHYRSYPTPNYEDFVKKKVQFNNEKSYLFSKYARAPQGVQLEEKLRSQPRNVKFYKPLATNSPPPLPRGADLEQLDLFEDHPAKKS